jgi:hypothetical protein
MIFLVKERLKLIPTTKRKEMIELKEILSYHTLKKLQKLKRRWGTRMKFLKS